VGVRDSADLDLVDVALAIRERSFSSHDVTMDCLQRIKAWGGNTFRSLDADAALVTAAERDRELDRGFLRGPLHGVPLAHKDIFDRPGVAPGCGSPMSPTHVPTRAASVLDRLARAGAVDLGPLHMAEFALGPTGDNAHFGPGRNPWQQNRVSGGSSSGSGIAVAAGMVYGSLGTDTGGSIRLPAAMCGVFGLKPTFGAVASDGVFPLSWSMDTVGPLTRSARDLRRLYRVITGTARTPDDALGTANLAGDGGRRPTLGLLAPDEDVEPGVRELIGRCVDCLSSLGIRTVPIVLPGPEEVSYAFETVLSVEAASVHQHMLDRNGAEYGPNVLSRIAAGFDVSAVQYARALRNRQLMVHEVEASLSQVDALLTPSVGIVTPTLTDVNEASPEQLAVLFRQITRWMRLPSYLGLPVVQAPIGTVDGLPVGVQLVGKRGSDVLLTHLAKYL